MPDGDLASAAVPGRILQPHRRLRPRGDSSSAAAAGKLVPIAGRVGCSARQPFLVPDLAGAVRQLPANGVPVLATAVIPAAGR